MAASDVERLRRALADVDFPAEKTNVVRSADQTGADDDTVRALKSVPPVTYSRLLSASDLHRSGVAPILFASSRQTPDSLHWLWHGRRRESRTGLHDNNLRDVTRGYPRKTWAQPVQQGYSGPSNRRRDR
ncbi:MAG TPA: DUF2795 domain-containing protein [Pseudonocardiaceae bacterium]|nr:DUF2795 domain-containing protein [Pseudonocardiaceae bacterium]